MSKSIANALMNHGNSYQRQMGRLLSRGRIRGINSDLQMALDIADKVLKDGGGAAGPMTGAQVYTPVPGSNKPPIRKKKSRLMVPSDE